MPSEGRRDGHTARPRWGRERRALRVPRVREPRRGGLRERCVEGLRRMGEPLGGATRDGAFASQLAQIFRLWRSLDQTRGVDEAARVESGSLKSGGFD